MKNILLVFVSSIIFTACKKDQTENLPSFHAPCDNISGLCEITGTLQKQGITYYMYGTYNFRLYKSDLVNLDEFINRNVTIIGYKIDGYPVDGGPVYIKL